MIALSMAMVHAGSAQEGPPGITRPVVFPPFDPNAPACSRPASLRKVLTFAQDNERKFMQGVARGLELAARDRGLTFGIDHANNDPVVMMEQVRKFVGSNGGALVIALSTRKRSAPLSNRRYGPAPMSARWFRRRRFHC